MLILSIGLLIFVQVLSIISGIIGKEYQKRNINITSSNNELLGVSLKQSCYGWLLTTIILLVIVIFKGFTFTWYSFVCAISVVLVQTLATVLSIKTLSMGSFSISKLFSLIGGFFIPYLYGVIFLKEEISLLFYISIPILILGFIFYTLKDKKDITENKTSDKKFIIYVVLLSIAVGLSSTLNKIHQSGSNISDIISFMLMISSTGFVALKIILLFMSKSHKMQKIDKKSSLYVALIALIGTVSGFLSLWTANYLSASLIGALGSGISVALIILSGTLVYKEKLSVKKFIAVILCLIAVVLASI